MKISRIEYGPEKTSKSAKELAKSIVAASECTVTRFGNHLRIELTGMAADIPSLKNGNSFAGANKFMPKGKIAKLKALDELFLSALKEPMTPQTSRISVIVSNRERNNRFDTNNTFQTICDWLEDPKKISGRGHARGWGVGLVVDDSQISGSSYYSWELGFPQDKTIILIAPAEAVLPALRAYAEAHR